MGDLPTFTGADRMSVDMHPYFAFDGTGSIDVVPYIPIPCGTFSTSITGSQRSFGVTVAGEWSIGFNDCDYSSLDQRGQSMMLSSFRWPYVPLVIGPAHDSRLQSVG